MSLFKFFENKPAEQPKPTKDQYRQDTGRIIKTYSTTLNGNKAKGRQEILENLKTFNDPLKVYYDLKGGSTSLTVGKSSTKIAGTIDSKIKNEIETKYGSSNGISCSLEIESYKINRDSENLLVCDVELKVIKK